MHEGGVHDAWIVAEPGTHPIASPEDWWTMILGSGYRGTLYLMAPEMVEYVRQANVAFIAESHIREVQANVLYAVAEKLC